MKAPFDIAWDAFIVPLKGKSLETFSGEINSVRDVTSSELKRYSSKGNSSDIPKEAFRTAFNNVVKFKSYTRDEINSDYSNNKGNSKRGSSIIFAVLAQLPFFDVLENTKATLSLNKEKYEEFWNSVKREELK